MVSLYQCLILFVKPRLQIHDFLYSLRILMVRKIGMDLDESWRKVEIFSVTTIPVRNVHDISTLCVEPRLHIHDFLYDSARFARFLMVRKIGTDPKSGNIQCHYDSSKNVHGISTVSVRYRYESMATHDGNATVNKDQPRWHDECSRCLYGSIRY